MNRLICIVCVAVFELPAVAQQGSRGDSDQRQPRRSQYDRLREHSGTILDGLSRLGPWEEQYSYMIDAMERVFERNDWVSESDLYALDLVREVEALPPGDFFGRYEKMKQMLGDRYLLSEEQENRLGQTIMRESVGVFIRHSDRIMEYTMDAINTRAAGEAFKPEQIAKWVKLAEPVFRDATKSMEIGASQIMLGLEPEQRELMQRDLDAAKRRIGRMEELSTKWAKGEWDPSDWGMEDDPIQVAGEMADSEAKEVAAADKAAAEADARAERDIAESRRAADRQQQDEEQVIVEIDADDDAWAAYVKSFIRKYRLNEAQQNRAWAIYRDVKAYGDKLRARADKKTAGLKAERAKADPSRRPSIDRQIQEAAEPVRRVFDQMKRRLDRLPTRAQRRNADASMGAKPDTPREKINGSKKANRRADGP